MNWKDKRVLVTGSEGMIGKELCILLEGLGAKVYRYDKNAPIPHDVTHKGEVEETFKVYQPDYVFHLFGVKGSALMTETSPADFLIPMLQGDTNVIEAAHKYNVKGFLYTSSITVNYPDVDIYPAHAKSTSEMVIDSLKKQGTKTKYCIVRPSSVYGRFDNFNNDRAMVVTSLIQKSLRDEYIDVWGDGSQVRDFINAKDVARGMIKAMEDMPSKPVNLCSGKGITIKELAETIGKIVDKKVVFGGQKAVGSQKRLMDLDWDFEPIITLSEGVKEVIDANRNYAY